MTVSYRLLNGPDRADALAAEDRDYEALVDMEFVDREAVYVPTAQALAHYAVQRDHDARDARRRDRRERIGWACVVVATLAWAAFLVVLAIRLLDGMGPS